MFIAVAVTFQNRLKWRCGGKFSVRKRRLLLLASSEPFTEKRKGVCRSNDEILFGRFLACHFLELAPCFLACHFLCSDAAAPLLQFYCHASWQPQSQLIDQPISINVLKPPRDLLRIFSLSRGKPCNKMRTNAVHVKRCTLSWLPILLATCHKPSVWC